MADPNKPSAAVNLDEFVEGCRGLEPNVNSIVGYLESQGVEPTTDMISGVERLLDNMDDITDELMDLSNKDLSPEEHVEAVLQNILRNFTSLMNDGVPPSDDVIAEMREFIHRMLPRPAQADHAFPNEDALAQMRPAPGRK